MTGFYTQQKRVGRGLNSGETERERERDEERDGVLLWKGYGVGNKFDH
jgi:hypothetical protein